MAMTSAELVDYCKALMDRCRRGEADEAVMAAVATARAAKRELGGQLTVEQNGYVPGVLADARRAATRARRRGKGNEQRPAGSPAERPRKGK